MGLCTLLVLEGGGKLEAITTGLTGLATSVATNATSVLGSLLPVLAPVVAAIIVVRLGKRFIGQFSN